MTLTYTEEFLMADSTADEIKDTLNGIEGISCSWTRGLPDKPKSIFGKTVTIETVEELTSGDILSLGSLIGSISARALGK